MKQRIKSMVALLMVLTVAVAANISVIAATRSEAVSNKQSINNARSVL